MKNKRCLPMLIVASHVFLISSLFAQTHVQRFNLPELEPCQRFSVTDLVWPTYPGEADVCLWADDKIAAISFSVDDNVLPEHDFWVEQMEKRRWKMTWFIVTSQINSSSSDEYGRWSDFRRLDSLGYDIQSHSVNHQLDQDRLPDSVVDAEYRLSQKAINDSIPRHKCWTIAYPACAAKFSLAAKYFIAGRSCSGWADKANQISYMNVLTSSFYATWLPGNWVDKLIKRTNGYEGYYRGWLNRIWHHSDETTIPDLDLVKSNEASIWVASFTDVALYSQEYATHGLSITKANDDSITFILSDSLSDSIYTYPLTVKVRVSNEWGDAKAVQKGKAIPLRMVDNNGRKYILVKGVPDQGEVTLIKTVHVKVRKGERGEEKKIQSPMMHYNLNNGTLNVNKSIEQPFFIKLFSPQGQLINTVRIDPNHANAISHNLPTGIYSVLFQGENYRVAQQIFIQR